MGIAIATILRAETLQVRFGSRADLTALECDFRYAPESRHRLPYPACPESATTGLMHCAKFVSFDHLVSTAKQRWRDVDA
jgi:hypothetical protein